MNSTIFMNFRNLISNRNANYEVIKRSFMCTKYLKSANSENKESPLKRLLDEAATYENLQPQNAEQQWATMPYPPEAKVRTQGEYLNRKIKEDPRESSILLFPGQGTQYVGMAKDLMKFPMAKELFELANYILGYNLLKLCLKGPKEELDQTKYCQPAIMVTSLAAIECLKEERPRAVENCVATAGFSLGEITALVFAGALNFEKALKMVQIRAEAMQAASQNYKGGMLTAIFGPDAKLNYAVLRAKQWALEKGDPIPECTIANYLYPHSKIISGSESALQFLENNYKEFKILKLKRLNVSGAFHSSLMESAVEPVRRALNKMEILEPAISVFSNVDGKRYRNPEHIRNQLPKQIVKPVKWEQLLHTVYERKPDDYFPRTFECGPGSSLKTILKQVNAKAWNSCFSVGE